MKAVFWFFEDLGWSFRCSYNLWLHGPYGLSKVIEKMPFRYVVKYLKKYGATIGENCRFERGLNIHRPMGAKPFENLTIGNNVYLGHNIILDLTSNVSIKDKVAIGGRTQIWTHAGYYQEDDCNQPVYKEDKGAVTINKGTIIYSNSVISHSIIIGEFVKVGASSLVVKNVENHMFVGGIPAKTINKNG